MRNRLLLAVLVLNAAVASAFGGEAMLRALGTRPVITSEWLLSLPQFSDDELIFTVPSFRTDDYYRIAERPLVVLLGDSFTAGHPVAAEHAYPTILQSLLADGGSPIGEITLGTGNSGPDQHLKLFERELLPRISPDVVVWQLYPNDEYDNVDRAVYEIAPDRSGLRPLAATRNWIYRRQLFHDSFPAAAWLLERSYLYRRVLRIFERGKEAAVPVEYRSNARAWGLAKIALAVERMRELAAEHDFRLYFLLIAPQSLYLTGEEARLPSNTGFVKTYRRMFDLLAAVPGFIDARFYEDDGIVLRSDIFADDGRDPLAKGGRHFNEDGYHRLAVLVADRLLGDGVLAVSKPAGSATAAQ